MYRIFSKVLFLNTVAIVVTLLTLQMTIVGILNIAEYGSRFFTFENVPVLVFYLLYLLFDIWLLTATFLPIIKLNDKGISARSFFWRRHIKWVDIQTTRLLKVSNTRRGAGSLSRATVSFEIVQQPETENNAMTNKGIRVKTFIVVSKGPFKTPDSLSLGGQLLTHRKLTTEQDIAFEYEAKAWKIIREKLN